MKKVFVAVDIVENNKRYAHAWTFKSSENMVATFKELKNAEIIHLCDSKKQAAEIVKQWNRQHKENNCYMFNDLF